MWSVVSGALVRTLPGKDESRAAAGMFSPDGKTPVIGANDASIKLWTLASGQVRELAGVTESINSVAFSPDGRLLAAGGSNLDLNVWNVQSGKLVHTLKGNTDFIDSVTFSPDSRSVDSTSQDYSVRL